MPRVKLTARSWLAAAAFGAGISVAPALAAAPGPAKTKAAAAAPRERAGDTEARRREEIDALERQDIADALKRRHDISVDWRTTSLDKLIEIRLRAAKAADLQQRLGVSVDWQSYSWIELEALRRTLLSFEKYRNAESAVAAPAPAEPPAGGAPGDALVRPTFKERPPSRSGRPADPDGVIHPTFGARAAAPADARDPDGVIRPTFLVRPRWRSATTDPDGLIAPTFAPTRRFATIGDADELIDLTPTPTSTPAPTPARAPEGRPVPARW